MSEFATLELPPSLAQAIAVMGYAKMTPVQAQALPLLLAGRDIIAQAPTGSGKTLAFGIPLLAHIDIARTHVQALVLCPTRELADQVTGELRGLGRLIPNLRVVTLCGGVPAREQRASLERAPHVVVGTPGRILDHLARQNLDFARLSTLVLDEADRMLDMGFHDAIQDIVGQCSRTRQTLLFSATYPDAIRALSRTLQTRPADIAVASDDDVADIEQIFFDVTPARKLHALTTLLDVHVDGSALVFCHTRNDTRQLASELSRLGYSALALHGDLEQRERDEVLMCFTQQSCSILVATDVAARGLDIKGLPAVIAWELPLDPDVHTHRIGRTGRAGQRGLAISMCAPNERKRAIAIEQRLGAPLRWGDLPEKLPTATPKPAPMRTIAIEGGRQDKLRPGDLLGALTGDMKIPAAAIGKIAIHTSRSYVAITREHAGRALTSLQEGKIKGRKFRVRKVG